MDFKIPDKITFKRNEVINITQLDGKVIDYWEKEFGGFTPVVNRTGEKFYTRKDIESILLIKQLFVGEKKSKSEIRTALQNIDNPVTVSGSSPDGVKEQQEKLNSVKKSLQEILTLLDKNDKK